MVQAAWLPAQGQEAVSGLLPSTGPQAQSQPGAAGSSCCIQGAAGGQTGPAVGSIPVSIQLQGRREGLVRLQGVC